MSQPSFEKFNYLLRPNKHIERKLIFEMLGRVSSVLPLHKHRYIGFGSMWFGDFVLAHKLLGIDNMWSLELKEHAPRADFNRPYAPIQIVSGLSTETLQAVAATEWGTPAVCWLDYDGMLQESVVKDIDIILRNCSKNSVLIVTVNALRKQYRPREPKPGQPTSAFEIVQSLLHADIIEPRFDKGKTAGGVQIDVSEAEFPEFLSSAIQNYSVHKIASGARTCGGEQLVMIPLANVCHVDGAEMITIAGAVTTREDAAHWKAAIGSPLAIEGTNGRLAHLRLDLAPITIKEKLAMDRCLPSDATAFVQAVASAGVRLSDDQLSKYRDHYLKFPIYSESVF